MTEFVEADDPNNPPVFQGSRVQQEQAVAGMIGMLNRRYDLDLVTLDDVEQPFSLDAGVSNTGGPIGATVPMTGNTNTRPRGASPESVAKQFPAARSRLVK